jgi:hypothetical protein
MTNGTFAKTRTTMKKILIALVASVALVLGTGALVNGASAAYPNSVATKTSIASRSSVNEGKSFTVKVRVKAGNAKVSDGKAKVVFGGRTYTVTIKNGVATFKVKAPKVKKTTKKTLKVSYKPSGSSVYKPSGASKTIKVKD